MGEARYNQAMKSDPAEVLRDALALPPEARAELVDSLIESMDAGDDGIQAAWREEGNLRLQQIDTGAVTLIPWEEARAALHSRLTK
jgi:putative addiction module component (TIGR02574 family)